jgi:hypothetical protein
MAVDIAATTYGDISIINGDIALTGRYPEDDRATAVELAQRVYFALKTEVGDLVMHPTIGNRMGDIVGLPNNPETAEMGKALILKALSSVGITNGITIDSWPGPEVNKINFEIKITFGAKPNVISFIISSIVSR